MNELLKHEEAGGAKHGVPRICGIQNNSTSAKGCPLMALQCNLPFSDDFLVVMPIGGFQRQEG